jgi:hypothetical protein
VVAGKCALRLRRIPKRLYQIAALNPRIVDAIGRRGRVTLEARTDLCDSKTPDRMAGVMADV